MSEDIELYKFLMASPASFVGSTGECNPYVELTHVFENFLDYDKGYKKKDESHHLAIFRIKDETEKRAGVVIPNYYPVGELTSQIMTVFFGKLIIPLGFIRASNTYCLPERCDLNLFPKNLPFYSSKARFEFPVKLNRGVIKNMNFSKLDKVFIDASKVYQNALIDYPKDSSIAYMSLVSAGEILASEFKFKEKELYTEEIVCLFDEIRENWDDGNVKVGQLKNGMRQIKKKFVLGLSKYFDDKTVSNEKGVYKKLTGENIQSALEASYDLRSLFLHEGYRMGRHTRFTTFEVGLSHSIGDSEKLKRVLDNAPNFVVLERFIRFSLLKKLLSLHKCELIQFDENNPFDMAL